ncbi:Gamma-glutamyltransferase [Yarrowia sp. B02]|nr:Gamma-glutamyltransferase [Yarrowia sp. B02]
MTKQLFAAVLAAVVISSCLLISYSSDIVLTPSAGWKPGDQHPNYYRQDVITNDKKINIPLRKGTYTPSEKRLKVTKQAAVSCDVPLCSEMGSDILKRGGSAVDAAITVALCIGSVNGFSSGIGGGGFMVVKDPKSRDLSFDFRETAPHGASKDMFQDDPKKAQFGGLAVATPGEVSGLYEAYVRYSSGLLSWKELFEPVIELNKRGWLVDKAFELALEVTEESLDDYGAGDWSWVYRDDSAPAESADSSSADSSKACSSRNADSTCRTRLKSGDLLARRALAETLTLIANNGSSAIFYDPEGPIAPKLVDAINKAGGVASLKDFENYKTTISKPIRGEFYDREVLVADNPSSGPALVVGLNIIDELDKKSRNDKSRDLPRDQGLLTKTVSWFKSGFWFSQQSHAQDDSAFSAVFPFVSDVTSLQRDSNPISNQRLVEAMKYTSSARTELGDPADISNDKRIDYLLTSAWTDACVSNISDWKTHPWEDYQPAYEVADSAGTAHFSILDKNGMAVAMTTTVNLLFGSLVYDSATGVILNSEMDDFSIPSRDNAYELRPSIYNYIAPGKRPLSSTTPTIVFNKQTGHVELVIGAAGGSRIVTAVLQAIVRKYSYGLSLLQTIAFPRLHHQLIPEVAYIEIGGRKSIGEALRRRGHGVEYWIPRSVMNAISREENGDIHAVADYWRKGGGSDGY